MNAVEIEEAVCGLAEAAFDAAEFPRAFLEAFGNGATATRALHSGAPGESGVRGAVLQRDGIHLAVCEEGDVPKTLAALKDSPATARERARFVLATDGVRLEAEDLNSGDRVACDYPEVANHLGFFLPLAGIATVGEISENAIDVEATGRLDRLYAALLKDNRDWRPEDRRPAMNRFMARLIFCFFAEDTGMFRGAGGFTRTIADMSGDRPEDTDPVIGELFRAMGTKSADRAAAGLPPWADAFPCVNGGLFDGASEIPAFGRDARSCLFRAGALQWRKIDPAIFGAMIQAIADDAERGTVGMHYTSAPNILKVLNPLFLDDLRERLAEAGDDRRRLTSLRRRLSSIRVFDPACGSGNFLVIAYKEMRAIEAGINARLDEADRRTDIPLTNFRGIELLEFPAEIARLALVIAGYQCDVLYRGRREALGEVLPLDTGNWIVCGNALRLDWASVCPPTGTAVRHHADDLFDTPLDQLRIDFDNDGGETYVCGNPPYVGSRRQTALQKSDMRAVFEPHARNWRVLDYAAGWFMKAADYGARSGAVAAFVCTNSICQGQQVPVLWPAIFGAGHEIAFARTSFKWTNLASGNAGVTVGIVGISRNAPARRRLYGNGAVREVDNISPYLIAVPTVFVEAVRTPPDDRAEMRFGNMPRDGGHLLLSDDELAALGLTARQRARFCRRIAGSAEFIRGLTRHCLWIEDEDLDEARAVPAIAERLARVAAFRSRSAAESTRSFARAPHRFVQIQGRAARRSIVVPRVSSENRRYLPAGVLDSDTIVSDSAFALYDAPLWNMAALASRLHLVWIAAVCGKLKTDFRYSNTLGWNTFPLPPLTEKDRTGLARCAGDILRAREAGAPATVADLYDPDAMPERLREAHEANDETLERVYVGRRFRNDTERLETLFDLYRSDREQRGRGCAGRRTSDNGTGP